jgi:hypothetical protein
MVIISSPKMMLPKIPTSTRKLSSWRILREFGLISTTVLAEKTKRQLQCSNTELQQSEE